MTASAEVRDGHLANGSFVPRLRFSTERLTVNRGDHLTPCYEDVTLPVISLSFDYPWGTVRASDEQRLFIPSGPTMLAVERHVGEEAQIRMCLERFGAVELDMVDVGAELDSEADYLLGLDEEPGHFCHLTRQIEQTLRARGGAVEFEDGYPYQLVAQQPSFYVDIQGDEERPDWFGLQLGIEVQGERINLLPVFVSMLERARGLESLDALRLCTSRLTVVPVGERYMELAPSLMESVWRVLVELYGKQGSRRERLEFSMLHAPALAQLGPALAEQGDVRWYGDRSPRRRAEQVWSEPRPITQQDLHVRATLRPYQLEGVAWLQHLTQQGLSGVLADDMGLGKTLQTITHVDLELRSGRAQHPCLVVCPTSLVGNWSRELARFAPHVRVAVYHGPQRERALPSLDDAQVVITTYPVLSRDEAIFAERHFHLVILDEAQAIKTRTSQLHALVKRLSCELRLCLSGTPIENNLGELWALFDFLEPGLLGAHDDFRQRFPDAAVQLGDELRMGALTELVSPYILRRTKQSVARDLPPKTHVIVPVELSGKQRELYEGIRCSAHAHVRQVIKKQGFEQSTIAILDALMKLRQLCCDPRLVRLDAARFVRESAKYHTLMQRLEGHVGAGRRVLIFSQFTRMLSLIGEGLDERQIDYLCLTGATRDRQAKVDAFEAGLADVFLISLKAGGTGLNLTSADTVIHYDPWWNPAAQDQATDRAYRIGQQRPVVVEQFVVTGSVEERMLSLQQRKRELASAVLDSQAPAGVRWTEHDVDDLFAPLERSS